MSSKRLPFQGLGARGWQNLGIAALLVIYLLGAGWELVQQGLFAQTMGVDYLVFWSAGRVANHDGYRHLYDLQRLGRAQFAGAPYLSGRDSFFPAPFPLLPVFVLPFQLLALLDARPSYFVWLALNGLLFALYLRFFLGRLVVQDRRRLVLLALFAYPVYYNLFCGQVNVLLAVLVAEFARRTLSGDEPGSGVWLALALIKPQILPFLLLMLLLRRKWKALAAFALSALVLLGASAAMSRDGLIGLLELWGGFLPGVDTNAVGLMINWRMVGDHLASLLTPAAGWGIAVAGMLATLALLAALWKKRGTSKIDEALVLFGTLAGTLAATWHSHLHMAAVLVPLLVLLYGRRVLPGWLANLYIFGPPLALIILSVPVGLLGWSAYNLLAVLTSLGMLALHLSMLAWAAFGTGLTGTADRPETNRPGSSSNPLADVH